MNAGATRPAAGVGRSVRRFVLLAALAAAGPARGEAIAPTVGIDWPALGRIAPRPARAIASSPWWSIGGETLDRDFAAYQHYRPYLGPLGAKSLRLQAGWAKCERKPGVYDWSWLDVIVDDAVAQGVRPWLEFNYGNPVYPGGGDTGLGGGLPSSPEALAAWDRWARALVERYRDRVFEWEVWNEPDINRAGTASVAAYLDLYVRTASIVRELQPGSRLWALGLAGNLDYADQFLAGLKARRKLDLVDAITIHGYPRNPDDTGNIDRLRAVIAKHGRAIEVRQGETGAPSRYQEQFALSKLPWSETTQAKWNLRRLLAHRAKDVPMNLFSMSDMHYTQYHSGPEGVLRMNYKGLLATHPDQTIAYAKPAYHAAQHVFTIFDGTVERIADFPFTSGVAAPRRLAVTGYSLQGTAKQIVALWLSEAPPREDNAVTRIEVTFVRARFEQPVLVDLRTGFVYRVPAMQWNQSAAGAAFRGLPVYDSPVLIAEQCVVGLVVDAR